MALIHSPSEILARYFIGIGLGQLPPLPPAPNSVPAIYDGYFPPEGDFAVCVYDTVGKDQGRSMRVGQLPVVYPGIQVRVRAPGKVQAFDVIMRFRQALIDLSYGSVSFPDANYCIVNAQDPKMPVRIGQEVGKNRYAYTLNCTVNISQFSTVCNPAGTTTTSAPTTTTTPAPTTTTTTTSSTTTTTH